MNAPKLHHYVPQFHLCRFADDKGQLWIWDKHTDRVFAAGPGGIAAETQFYRLTQYEPDGHDPLTMEKQLSEMTARRRSSLPTIRCRSAPATIVNGFAQVSSRAEPISSMRCRRV